ncbi:MAG: aminoglycoside phosphotransferase family protein [Nitrospirota bacterium]|nr:aminoglycoside phosphotransferase family protein [Nitrospirota bacterium]
MRAVKSRLSDMGSHEDYRLEHTIERPYSSIAIIGPVVGKNAGKLVVKTIKHHPINASITKKENQAVVEYDILMKLYPQFLNVNGCAVPRPVIVIPEIETYVMEFVEGDLLMDANKYLRYASSRRKSLELQELYFLCGKWLRIFHEVTGIEKRRVDVFTHIMERCDQRLELIEQSSHSAIPKGFREQVLATLTAYLDQLSGSDILVAGRHGDFGPWNILYNAQGITVLDFLGFQKDPLPVDIMKFLVFLDNERMSVTCSKKRVNNLKDRFIEGYGPVPSIQEAVFLVCEILHRVVSIWGDVSAPGKHLHHKMESAKRIERSIQWLRSPSRSCLWPCN